MDTGTMGGRTIITIEFCAWSDFLAVQSRRASVAGNNVKCFGVMSDQPRGLHLEEYLVEVVKRFGGPG